MRHFSIYLFPLGPIIRLCWICLIHLGRIPAWPVYPLGSLGLVRSFYGNLGAKQLCRTALWHAGWVVWSLTSLFRTHTAISETTQDGESGRGGDGNYSVHTTSSADRGDDCRSNGFWVVWHACGVRMAHESRRATAGYSEAGSTMNRYYWGFFASERRE